MDSKGRKFMLQLQASEDGGSYQDFGPNVEVTLDLIAGINHSLREDGHSAEAFERFLSACEREMKGE
jgi:hypothetical protein